MTSIYRMKISNAILIIFAGTLRLLSQTVPVNDELPGAVTLSPSVIFNGNFNGATVSSCATSCNGGGRDLWYKFTATKTTHLGVIRGLSSVNFGLWKTCGANNVIMCGNSGSSASSIVIPFQNLSLGVTYYLNLFGPLNSSFSISLENSPINDNCSGATVLVAGNSPVNGTIAYAAPGISNNTCTGIADDEVWYKFIATRSAHIIRVNTDGNGDMVLALFGSCTGNPIACGDNSSIGKDSLVATGLIPGATYYIAVYEKDISVFLSPSDYAFNIAVINPCATGPVATVSGKNVICGGGTVLTANAGPGYTYQWRKSGINIPGATLRTYTATVAGYYSVRVTNLCGQSAVSANKFYNNAPYPNASITSGPTTVCAGNIVTMSALNPRTDLSYRWYRNNVLIQGATSAIYNANMSGSYTLKVNNICGDYRVSGAIPVTIKSTPSISISAPGGTSFCTIVKAPLAGTTDAGSGASYQWLKDGSIIPGATALTYTATAAGSYSLKVTNTCGFAAVTPGMLITLLPRPVPLISASGPLTFCTGGSVVLDANAGNNINYTWFKDINTNIVATTKTYTATTSGVYWVIAKNVLTGCYAPSASVKVTVSNCKTIDSVYGDFSSDISPLLYPNPFVSYLAVKLPAGIEEAEFRLYDLTGRLVLKHSLLSAETIIERNTLPEGIYIYRIVSAKGDIDKGKIIAQ